MNQKPKQSLLLLKCNSCFIALGVYLAYTMIASFFPLLSNFGFEYSLFFAALAGIFSMVVSVDLMFLFAPPADDELRAEGILRIGVLTLFMKILLVNLAIATFAALVHIITSKIGHTTCNWVLGTGWFLMEVPITIIYATVWGMLIGAFLKSRKFALALGVFVVLIGIGLSLYEMAVGPHCFAFNPFFGYFPGPIYDRVVNITDAFIAFRIMNLATAVFLGCFLSVAMKISIRRGGVKGPTFSAAELFFGLICFAAIIVISFYQARLGIISSEEIVRKELSATKETRHFNIYYPPDGPIAENIDFIAADHEFRFKQITTDLGIDFDKKIHSYIYSSDGQKKRLQGAGSTMYADVSNAAIHMSYRDFPHHVLKHEMTHVISAVMGLAYFGWSSKVGLTEGIAVAEEEYKGDATTHQWAKAMKDLGKLPRITKIMGAMGFWSKSGSRSYRAAGSFSAWLIEADGIEKYKQVYKWANWHKVYGVDLEMLQSEWFEYLDRVVVPEKVMAQAREKFTRKSIFELHCARETERLLDKGERLYNQGRYTDAEKVFQKAVFYGENNPKALINLMSAQGMARHFSQSLEKGARIVDNQGGLETLDLNYNGPLSPKPVVVALAYMARTNWMQGKLDIAHEQYEQIYNSKYSDSYTRLSHCALAGLEDSKAELYFRIYLASDIPSRARFFYLFQAVQKYPENAILRYLLGRRLFSEQQYFFAADHLLTALGDKNLHPSLRTESLLLLGQSLYFLKRFTDAQIIFNILSDEQISDGQRQEALEWLERVDFTRDYPDLQVKN